MREYGFSAKFSDFFGSPPIPFQIAFRSSQVSNELTKEYRNRKYRIGIDCTGGPDIHLPFFTQTAEEPNFAGIRELQERKGIGNKYCKSLRTNGIRVKKKSSGSED